MKRFTSFKWRLKKKKFQRYIISYLLVFLIPCSIISAIWYKTSIDSLNKQIDLSTNNYLLQVRSIFSNNFMQLNNLTKEIGTNPKMTPKMMSHPYYSMEAVEEIKSYKIANNNIEEMYLYYFDEPNKLFSSTGSIDFNTFNQFKYGDYEFDPTELEKAFENAIPTIEMIPSVTPEKRLGLLSYIVPLNSTDGSQFGSVMYTMGTTTNENILKKAIDKNSGRLYIVDDENDVIASSINAPLPSFFDTKEKIKETLKDKTVKTGSEHFKVNMLQDEDLGLTYVTLVNADAAFKELSQTNRFIWLSVFLVVVLGAGLVLLIGKKQYKPIRNLEKLLATKLSKDPDFKSLDDFDSFEYHVSNFLEQNENLHQEILRQTPYAKEQVLRRLMNGRFTNEEETETLLKSVNLELIGNSYFVMLIDTKMINTLTTIQNQEFLMSFLGDLKGDGFRAYGFELLNEQSIALLVSLNGKVKLTTAVREIVNKIVKENSVVPIVGVGQEVNEIKHINRSYIESLTAMQSISLIEKQETIYYYSDISQNGNETSGFSYLKDEKLKLIQSLIQGDFEIACETIDLLISSHLNTHLNQQGMKLYGFDLLTAVTDIGLETIGDEIMPEAEKGSNFRNLSELRASLIQISRQICLVSQKGFKNKETQRQKEIIEYLKEHFASHDLSLETLAGKFDVSVSYLSRFIKKETGLTFAKYIQDLRFEHIKMELIETDKPIKEIILGSGYYDVSNYTRKFKLATGLTPSQFRNKNR